MTRRPPPAAGPPSTRVRPRRRCGACSRTTPGGVLRGIVHLPEGTGGKPAAYELFAELS
ncbi:hypothetical protein [Streptomyces sp. NPDC056255]|uniref:hypothetical protein n=1 Tax=Streptomyces sp. NPDC056255 TaxID=3345764 RepID=UPI0035E25352